MHILFNVRGWQLHDDEWVTGVNAINMEYNSVVLNWQLWHCECLLAPKGNEPPSIAPYPCTIYVVYGTHQIGVMHRTSNTVYMHPFDGTHPPLFSQCFLYCIVLCTHAYKWLSRQAAWLEEKLSRRGLMVGIVTKWADLSWISEIVVLCFTSLLYTTCVICSFPLLWLSSL